MEQNAAAFAEIKKFEDMLAKDPKSFCFAPLADTYRKLGLLDEAISVAKKGLESHPTYVGGLLALGRAYFEKGMKDESRAVLERVVASTPDNILAQKLLGQLYIACGNTSAAEKALQIAVSANPGDTESAQLLASLKKPALQSPPAKKTDEIENVLGDGSFDFSFDEQDVVEEVEEVIEAPAIKPISAAATAVKPIPTEIPFEFDDPEPEEVHLDEDDILLEPDAGAPEGAPLGDAFVFDEPSPSPQEIPKKESKDPLTTVTLAELYVSQGFLQRALNIYSELCTANPGDAKLSARLQEVRALMEKEAEQEAGEADVMVNFDAGAPAAAESAPVLQAKEVESGPAQILERWLENIRRRRECR